ncbi:MAG: ABC transporter ATP-binding protein [Alphaproteobacteria bacterium]
MTAQSPAIEVEKLVKRFGDVAAVDGISFTVPRGATAALLGGNGAGKTTTIGMILGLVRPTAGRIRVLGHDIATERYKVLPRMNFESPFVDLPKRLSVAQNLEIYARLYSVPNFKARIAELAEELQLGDLMKRPAGQLSAGQKTRVGLAKALLNAPEVLFLDEPTASLDPDTGDWVRSLLERYKKQHHITTLLASHNMDEVERLVDEVFMMSRGKIVARGTPHGLIERFGRANMEEVFLDVARGRELKFFEPEAAE